MLWPAYNNRLELAIGEVYKVLANAKATRTHRMAAVDWHGTGHDRFLLGMVQRRENLRST